MGPLGSGMDGAVNFAKSGQLEIHRLEPAWLMALHHLSTAVESLVESPKTPAQRRFFTRNPPFFQALSGFVSVAMIAAPRSLAEGAVTRRAASC